MAVVIDTNVLQVANGNAPQADPTCVLATIDRLESVRRHEIVCLDISELILQEYIAQRFSFAGQPGAGDAFFKWIFDNQANQQHCEQVLITPRHDDHTNFDEFPDDPALAGFDRSDRKFVAVALASSNNPTVLNAVDSDWRLFGDALAANGVTVEELCAHLVDD
jgi:hypothetical protein